MEGAEKSGKLAPAQIKLPHWSLSISGRHTCERGEFRLRFMVPLGRVKPLGRVIKDSSVNYFVHIKNWAHFGRPNSRLRRQCHYRFRQIRAFIVHGSTYDSRSFPFQTYQSFGLGGARTILAAQRSLSTCTESTLALRERNKARTRDPMTQPHTHLHRYSTLRRSPMHLSGAKNTATARVELRRVTQPPRTAKEAERKTEEGYLCIAALICRTDSYIGIIISNTAARLG